MTLPRYSDWLNVVEFRKPAGEDEVVFVDVGGNVGHQCQRLLAAHPELAGSIVLQDLEETISAAPSINGVKPLAHDFFKPNPVKGK
jgi:demethylsterigmatocystin 6-O-methyltransferase